LANCSLLLVPGSTCEAYYVHGKNVGGEAESSLEIIGKLLQQEKKLMMARGIQNGVDGCQTFAFYMTKDLVETMKSIRQEDFSNPT
jgi:hypothetical protein